MRKIMRRPLTFILAALGILLALSGCGFHPRGPVTLAPPLHMLYLQTRDPYGQLSHNLVRYFKSAGVYLTSSPASASTILDIMHEDTSQQLLSVGGTQQTRQYNLILSVTFQLMDARGTIIIPPTTVTQTRSIPIQSNQILGGSNEANNLYRQMRQAIVYDIANRLAAQNVTNLLMTRHR